MSNTSAGTDDSSTKGATPHASRTSVAVESRSIGGLDVELLRGGQGEPLLVLHGFHPLRVDCPFLAGLTPHAEVFAPSLPGFGHTERPADFDTIYDLVHFCFALIEEVARPRLHLLGLSFGGWLALEIAVKSCAALDRLVLVDNLGLKLSGRETADIADIFNLHPDEVLARRWHQPAYGALDFDAMSDAEITTYARERESLCLYGWQPYMHSPQLARWLHRVQAPSLVAWGASDRVVSVDYGRTVANRISGARFEIIPEAGHHPEIEQPQQLAAQVASFLTAGGQEA